MKHYIINELTKSKDTIDAILSDENLISKIEEISHVMVKAIKNGNKILLAGNGGSAADSQHLAAELVSRLCYDRPAIAAIALTTDTSALTAIGNDYGYKYVFSRQIEAIANKGDIFIAISTSGMSENILLALEVAKNNGVITIGFSNKNGGEMQKSCDYMLNIPSPETPKVQEGHIIIGHIICSLVEETIYGEEYNPSKS